MNIQLHYTEADRGEPLLFALKYPERVNRLILNGANLEPKGVKIFVQLPIILGYHLASLFAKKSPKARKNAELLGLMVNEPHIAPAQLAKLQIPTLVIAGTKDMIRTGHTRLIAKNIPRAQLQLLPGTHFIANQSPAAFNRAVAEFLETDFSKIPED